MIKRLGIESTQDNLGTVYIDLTSGGPVVRLGSPSFPVRFVDNKINSANAFASFKPQLPSLPAWIMVGSIREDDVPLDVGARENNPQDEPGGSFKRVFNHFFIHLTIVL